MNPPRASRWTALLVAPLLLAPIAMPAYTAFQCKYDQIVRRSCCCPQGETPPPGTSLSKAPCCEVVTAESGNTPFETHVVGSGDRPAIDAAPAFMQPAALVLSLRSPTHRFRTKSGPPVLQVTQSLLI